MHLSILIWCFPDKSRGWQSYIRKNQKAIGQHIEYEGPLSPLVPSVKYEWTGRLWRRRLFWRRANEGASAYYFHKSIIFIARGGQTFSDWPTWRNADSFTPPHNRWLFSSRSRLSILISNFCALNFSPRSARVGGCWTWNGPADAGRRGRLDG